MIPTHKYWYGKKKKKNLYGGETRNWRERSWERDQFQIGKERLRKGAILFCQLLFL